MQILLFLLFSINLLAQSPKQNTDQFGCKSEFYQLINNQLHSLSADGRGQLLWVPILPVFERRLTVISYCNTDGYLYSFDSTTHELILINTSGNLKPLGIPIHENSKEKLNTQFAVGEIAGEIFCAYSKSEKQLYWINIKTNTYTNTSLSIKGDLLNLAYHPIEGDLYTIALDGWTYRTNPQTKKWTKDSYIRELPDKEQAAGNLWIANDRLFASRKNGTAFYELNETMEVFYTYKGVLPKTVGDATSCSATDVPIVLKNNLLEWRADKPNRDRIMLHWIGLYEEKNNSYIVEHSTDNRFWQECDWKPSADWNLYENPYGSYSRYMMDKSNYYRLKIIEDNGQFSYSRTIFIGAPSNAENIIVSPKLVQNSSIALYLSSFQNKLIHIRVYNFQGQLVKEEDRLILSAEMTLGMELDGLPTGMYQVEVVGGRSVWQECFFLIK